MNNPELNHIVFCYGSNMCEYEMLKYPDRAPGYFCVSTSYRNEPNPVAGRHDLIFPMFEFELKGGMDEMVKIEKELVEYLGFGEQAKFVEVDYSETAKKYDTPELEHEHEERLCEEHGPVVFLKDFPVEKFYRDSKLCTIGEGTSEIQKLVISRKILSK